jgi:glycerol-3-phosphate acyltransferase PlsY
MDNGDGSNVPSSGADDGKGIAVSGGANQLLPAQAAFMELLLILIVLFFKNISSLRSSLLLFSFFTLPASPFALLCLCCLSLLYVRRQ